MTYHDALERFLLQLRADGRSDHTSLQRQRHLRLLMSWITATSRSDDVSALGHEGIAEFFASDSATKTASGSKRRPGSVNALRTSVRGFFSYLHLAGTITSNPTRLLRRAVCSPPPPKSMGDADRLALLRALDEAATEAERRDRMIFRLLLRTGIRVGAAVALDIDDLDLERGEMLLRDGKGARTDVVFMPEEIAQELANFLEGSTTGPLFRARGERLTTRQVQRRLEGWCRRAGLKRTVSPHGLRHTFATRLLSKTGDLALVQKALRHRSIESTTVYATTSDERLRQTL